MGKIQNLRTGMGLRDFEGGLDFVSQTGGVGARGWARDYKRQAGFISGVEKVLWGWEKERRSGIREG